MLDERNQDPIEAAGAPIVEVELYIVTRQLGDQRPRRIPLNEEGLAAASSRYRLPGQTARGKVGARATKPTAFPAVTELSVAALLSASPLGPERCICPSDLIF
jgi:hypothetical protein